MPAPLATVAPEALIVEPQPGARSVAIVQAVRAGTRYAPLAAPGLAHLAEHLALRRPGDEGDRRRLSAGFDGLGAFADGETTRELILLSYQVRTRDLPTLLEIVRGGVRPRTAAPEQVVAELRVIEAEMRNHRDSGWHQTGEGALALALGGHPLAGSVLGAVEGEPRRLPEMLGEFLRRRWTLSRTAVAVSGALPPGLRSDDVASAFFAHRDPAPPADRADAAEAPISLRHGERTEHRTRARADAIWLVYGGPAAGGLDERLAFDLLEFALVAGAGGLLHAWRAAQRDLAGAELALLAGRHRGFLDCRIGLRGTAIPADAPARLAEFLATLADGPALGRRLTAARSAVAGRLAISADSPLAVATLAARRAALFGERGEFAAVESRLAGLDAGRAHELARALFGPAPFVCELRGRALAGAP